MIAKPRTSLTSLLCLLALTVSAVAQTSNRNTTSGPPGKKEKSKPAQVEVPESQLPAFAISIVISLANDARSYSDLALRPRVLARAADVLWDADNVTARELFKRAWEAAEKGDTEEVTIKTKDNPPAMAMALRRMSGRDLRFEVLHAMVRRDRVLFEEFFARLHANQGDDSKKKEVVNDSWFLPEAVSKRLEVASALLNDNQVERALELAAPVLNQVNVYTIVFLSELRAKNAEAADRIYGMLLARVEFDPAADANTVSGLSSYIFTPGLYVTFEPGGGTRWRQPDEAPVPPVTVPAALRNRFFQVASNILLQPLSPSDQERGSPERIAKSKVIRRLLPLFDQYLPDTAASLRAKLVELSSNNSPSREMPDMETRMLTQGINPEPSADDALEQMQKRIDRAKTSPERDTIYAAAAFALVTQGDIRARDIADKIENAERRTQTRQNVDFELVQQALKKKAAGEAFRFAQTGKLSNTQRAAAYIEVARLLRDAEPQRASDMLEDAVREVRRIEGDKPDRAILLVGVANQLVAADRVRAWEIMDEAVKEANRIEGFSGENQIHFPFMTSGGVKFRSVGGENFSLTNVFRSLARDDLYRALELARSFKYDAPRANVTLAIASSILEKTKTGLPN